MKILILLMFWCGLAPAQDALQARLQAIASAHHGSVAMYATDLQTGASAGLDPDKVVQTASVIKLAILYEALEQLRTGEVHWDDKLVMTGADRVPGSGVLHLLDAPLTLTLRDVLTLMIVMSDNAATDLAIDHLGLKNIDDRIASLGLKNTYLYKKIFLPVTPGTVLPEDFKVYGLGKTTPREMAELMTRIVRCNLGGEPRAGDAALCGEAIRILQTQFYRSGIPRYLTRLPGAVDSSIANKTGALDAVRNDVAAVSTRNGLIVLAEFTFGNADRTWGAEVEGELTMAKLALAVVDQWSPGGLAAWPQPGAAAFGPDSHAVSLTK